MSVQDETPKQKPSNDDLISSYLGDFFGSSSAQQEEQSEAIVNPGKQCKYDCPEYYVFADPTVDSSRSLTTTIDVLDITSSNKMLSKPNSFFMLLMCLSYLRLPMTQRVRGLFLVVGERMIEDYEAANWKTQIPKTGVLSEAR